MAAVEVGRRHQVAGVAFSGTSRSSSPSRSASSSIVVSPSEQSRNLSPGAASTTIVSPGPTAGVPRTRFNTLDSGWWRA
jgi:hypothetical protein